MGLGVHGIDFVEFQFKHIFNSKCDILAVYRAGAEEVADFMGRRLGQMSIYWAIITMVFGKDQGSNPGPPAPISLIHLMLSPVLPQSQSPARDRNPNIENNPRSRFVQVRR